MAFPETSPPLARALAERNYSDPTAVQSAVLAPEAVAATFWSRPRPAPARPSPSAWRWAKPFWAMTPAMGPAGAPLALIVAPTRELALQVQRELAWLYQFAAAEIISCVGGMDPKSERRALQRGAHIVVGTPGRLRDHLERGALDVSGLKALVLDEADEMLDMGFREDLEFILETTPAERRTLLFSATLPKPIVTLAKRYQREALRIAASEAGRAHADIEYRAVRIGPRDSEHAVVNLLRYYEPPGALVFCNTREAVRHLQAILLERGFSVVALVGRAGAGRTQSGAAGAARRPRPHLRRHRCGRARHRSAEPRSCHPRRTAQRCRSAAAQERAHRPRRPQGHQRAADHAAARRRAEMLLAQARIKPVWAAAPSAYAIKALDQERLLAKSGPDRAGQRRRSRTGRASAGGAAGRADRDRSGATLSRRICRRPKNWPIPARRRRRASAPRRARISRAARRRATAASARPVRTNRVPRGPSVTPPRRAPSVAGAPNGHAGSDKTVWFRLNVGRERNADPKWLLPEICKQGGITKQDIGQIRIFDRDTRFEVDREHCRRLCRPCRRPDQEDRRAHRKAARRGAAEPMSRRARRRAANPASRRGSRNTIRARPPATRAAATARAPWPRLPGPARQEAGPRRDPQLEAALRFGGAQIRRARRQTARSAAEEEAPRQGRQGRQDQTQPRRAPRQGAGLRRTGVANAFATGWARAIARSPYWAAFRVASVRARYSSAAASP